MSLGWASIIKILLSNPFCFEIKISFHGVVLYCFSTKKIVCIQIAKMGFWCRGHDLRSDAKITWQRLVTRDASVTPCHENCHNFDTTLTQALVTCHWWRFERQIASDSFVNLCIRCIDVIIVLFIWDLTKDAEMHPKTCNLSSRWTKKPQYNRTNNVVRSEGAPAPSRWRAQCSNAAWLSHWANIVRRIVNLMPTVYLCTVQSGGWWPGMIRVLQHW